MTWGSHCPQCGKEECSWVRGNLCEGNAKERVRGILAQLDELDLPDHAYWQQAHDMLGLEPGTIESMIAKDPAFFGAT